MTANTIAALIHEIEQGRECATCTWLTTLPHEQQQLFGEYIERHTVNPKYSLARLHLKCAEMGYPLKYTAFKDCVRRHHVHR